MLKVQVSPASNSASDDSKSFEIEKHGSLILIGGTPFDGDIVQTEKDHFHVIWKKKSYRIEVTGTDKETKSVQLLINGHPYTTISKDRLDLLLERMGIQNGASQKINHIKAPMPGLIHTVFVTVGDEIRKGDSLLVLVAMKMENVIKASGDGVVKSLKVVAGEIVEKNQVLLEFE